MAIEFTDRYSGYSPSWLRICRGDCEAMGVYPKYMEDTGDFMFMPCEECHGTGKCSWAQTFARIPGWLFRGVKILYNIRPSSEYWQGHPFGYGRRLWVNVKVAYLSDLGIRM